MNRCFVFGALSVHEPAPFPTKDDFVIAADAGFVRLKELGITPDLLVGDFDSLQEQPDFSPVERLAVRKDDTDVGHAIETAIDMGYRTFFIFGAVGGWLDHTLANVQLSKSLAERGMKAVFVGDRERFSAIHNDEMTFETRNSGRISVFSLTEKSEGVDIEDLSYELENATLTNDVPLGVSNAFVGKDARIRVKNGTLLIVWENG